MTCSQHWKPRFCAPSNAQTQEARNDKYDDHDADDVENIHCALRFRLCDFNVKQRFHSLNKHWWRSEVPETLQQRALDARKTSGQYYTLRR